MAYRRGTQAPMDTRDAGSMTRALQRGERMVTGAASIFDEGAGVLVHGSGGGTPMPLDRTPDTSLMDVEMESITPPGRAVFTAVPVGAARDVGILDAAVPPAAAPPAPASPAGAAVAPAPQRGTAPMRDVVLRSSPPPPAARPRRSMADVARSYLDGEKHVSPPHANASVWDRPEMLLTYAQVIFNASILVVFLYLLFSMVWTIQRDVSQKVREYEVEYLGEIAACSAAYATNRCGTELQAPALSDACAAWQRCASRDPTVVGRARVTAETFAEILNGFVDAVSWKTMLFALLTLSIVVGATNSTLSFFRVSASNARDTDV
ncbi:hypothetical protein MSPP1_001650 [Malassezia sp. CBS 17886]|nr:hypothetical protein MSPP1_001650 [Malassezia sp. CBS 17886]